MSKPRLPVVLSLAAGVWLCMTLSACHRDELAAPASTAPAATPDPDAPPPGSQAAEAIGSDKAGVTRP